jgi:hypothetical protein
MTDGAVAGIILLIIIGIVLVLLFNWVLRQILGDLRDRDN